MQHVEICPRVFVNVRVGGRFIPQIVDGNQQQINGFHAADNFGVGVGNQNGSSVSPMGPFGNRSFANAIKRSISCDA